MTERIKILIAEDQAMVNEAFSAMLASKPNVEVVGKALDGSTLMDMLRTKAVDLILMDIVFHGDETAGIRYTKEVKKDFPNIKVLVVSSYLSKEFIKQTMIAGADGYLLKISGPKELLKGINEVMLGKKAYSSEVLDLLPEILASNLVPSKEALLTDREKQIICHIKNGKTSREIGGVLLISHHTVERHRKNIFNKLEVKNMAELTRYAVEKNICGDRVHLEKPIV